MTKKNPTKNGKKTDISATFVSADTSFLPVHTNTHDHKHTHTQRMCVEEGAREGDEE